MLPAFSGGAGFTRLPNYLAPPQGRMHAAKREVRDLDLGDCRLRAVSSALASSRGEDTRASTPGVVACAPPHQGRRSASSNERTRRERADRRPPPRGCRAGPTPWVRRAHLREHRARLAVDGPRAERRCLRHRCRRRLGHHPPRREFGRHARSAIHLRHGLEEALRHGLQGRLALRRQHERHRSLPLRRRTDRGGGRAREDFGSPRPRVPRALDAQHRLQSPRHEALCHGGFAIERRRRPSAARVDPRDESRRKRISHLRERHPKSDRARLPSDARAVGGGARTRSRGRRSRSRLRDRGERRRILRMAVRVHRCA